jgi:hypothetical protein
MLLTMQQQEDLVKQGLATKKINEKLSLVTYKYAKRVMYDYLWAKHPELMECRGHTYCMKTGELVLCPPQKSFNYDEAGNLPSPAWFNKPLDTPVLAARKWNGFMASARIWNGELVVGTTGTTNEETSKYVVWAREEILKLGKYDQPGENLTSVYEIIHTDDPHIVDDGVQRAVNLLARGTDVGIWPLGLQQTTLGDVLKESKTAKHEGWMVYDRAEYEGGTDVPLTCKIKTDYYVGKKKLMRMSPKNVKIMFNMNFFGALGLPESWHLLAEAVVKTQQEKTWVAMTDQQRRAIIEALEPKFCN